jgi:hypothetical protein
MYTPIAGTYSAIDSRTMILTLVDILHPIRMDEKDVETIVELNDLFEEMLKDARVISKDLTEGITNTGAAAALAICITIVQILILRENLWRGPIYIGVWAVGFALILVSGIRLIQKYLLLKNRYARFFEINKELGNK